MTKTIAVIGTFDTKPKEFQYIKELVESLNFNTLMIHTGVFESGIDTDITNVLIANEAGENIKEIAQEENRGKGTEALSKGLSKYLPKLYEEGKFDGVISLGGSGGTSIATAGMRELPIGVPKVMVSTMASGNISHYVGTSDIMMIPSIVDVAGLNDISKHIFTNAVHAICGMVEREYVSDGNHKPMIAASMFGLTTPAITKATALLEEKGYEVIVFHATGTGGRTMESLINNGYFTGVLDLTTTEWADELFGGVLNAGKNRLESAVKNDVPQVVSLGAMDMVNFGPKDTVPEKFNDRLFYYHNSSVTLMRTSAEENTELGKMVASKLKNASASTTLMVPTKGFSGLDNEGKEFYNPEANKSLIDTLKNELADSNVKIVEVAANINDDVFAKESVNELLQLIQHKGENK